MLPLTHAHDLWKCGIAERNPSMLQQTFEPVQAGASQPEIPRV